LLKLALPTPRDEDALSLRGIKEKGRIPAGVGAQDGRILDQAGWWSCALCCQQMDVVKMIAELRTERDQIDEAMFVLERIAYGPGRRRGRPPAWMTGAPRRRGRSSGSKNKLKAEVAA